MTAVLLEQYDKTQIQANDARKAVEALLHLLKDRVSHELFFSKAMERLSQSDILEVGTLGAAVAELRSYCATRASQSRTLADDVTADLIEPLQGFLAKQNSGHKKAVGECRTICEEAKSAKGSHDVAFQRYRRACTELEQVMARLESHTGDPESRYSDLSRLMSLKKECLEAAKLYKVALDQYQAAKQRYDARVVRLRQPVLYSYFEAVEKARKATVKDTLRKYVVYEMAWLRNLQYETEKMAGVMEGIDVDRDIANFHPSTKPPALPTLVYKSWTAEELKGSAPEENISMLARLRRATGRIFQFGTDEKAMKFIEMQVEKACMGEEMKLDEEYSLHTLLRDKAGRYFWLSHCQKKVAQGPISLSHAALAHLSVQMKMILHECEKAKEADLPLALLCIAQKVTSTTSSETLHSFLVALPTWKQTWIWEQAAERHNLGSHFALQSHMEGLGLDPAFIQNALGRYIRRPSLSVSERRRSEVSKTPKWVEDLDTRSPFKVRSTISISQAIPCVQTEEEDLDPELSTQLEEDSRKAEEIRVTARRKGPLVQVQNLPQDCDESALRAFFRPCGAVGRVLISPMGTGKIALLEFHNSTEAAKAASWSGADLQGHSLDIKLVPQT